jgi:hypothetical protein
MKKTALALATAFLFTAQAYAQSDRQEDRQDIQSDRSAIQKDNQALAKDHMKLNKHRARKHAAKVSGDHGAQAKESVNIGADKAAINEKEAEKKIDQNILEHHENELNKDSSAGQ